MLLLYLYTYFNVLFIPQKHVWNDKLDIKLGLFFFSLWTAWNVILLHVITSQIYILRETLLNVFSLEFEKKE